MDAAGGGEFALKVDKDIPGSRVHSQQEISILTRVCPHPHITNLIQSGDRCLLVEFGEVGDVISYIGSFYNDTAEMPIREVKTVALDVASALVHCHMHGVVHFDVKPDNVILNRDDRGDLRARLCDFGMSKRLPVGALAYVRFGSLEYVSPEICSLAMGPEVDAWAFGLLLYVLTLRNIPFKRRRFQGLAEWQWTSAARRATDEVGDPFALDLILGLLKLEPRSRLTLNAARNHPFFVELESQEAGAPVYPAHSGLSCPVCSGHDPKLAADVCALGFTDDDFRDALESATETWPTAMLHAYVNMSQLTT